MITKVKFGGTARFFIPYVLREGPGMAYEFGSQRHEANWHRAPHIIAGSYDLGWLAEQDPKALGALFDARWKAAGMRAEQKPVVHLMVRTAPRDRELGDGTWVVIAADFARRPASTAPTSPCGTTPTRVTPTFTSWESGRSGPTAPSRRRLGCRYTR